MTSLVPADAAADSEPADGAPDARAWLVPDRVLVVLTLSLAVLLLLAVIVSLVFWHTPAAQPIDVPSVARA